MDCSGCNSSGDGELMTDYKTLKGFDVKVVTSDPSPVALGQMWYNSTDSQLRVNKNVGAWAEGNNLNTARMSPYGSTAGIQTAAMACDGTTQSTEEYNGTSWAEQTPNTNTAKTNHMACGTQTAGLAAAGGPPPALLSEEYDGTSWTEGNDMGTARYQLVGFGTQTAGLGTGGYVTGAGTKGETEEYNGASWAESGDLNTTRHDLMGSGTQTAGIVSGGASYSADSEEYNGTGWTEGNNLNEGRNDGAHFGIQTATFCVGGKEPTRTNIVEEYNGTTWATGTAVNTSASTMSAAGTTTLGLVWGGTSNGSNTLDRSEEWTQAAEVQDVTSS